MNGFLYYIPGQPEATPESVGLEATFAGASVPSGEVTGSGGPDGNHGKVYALGDTVCGYYPDTQEWRKCGAFWLGWYRDETPGPQVLERNELIGGHRVKLCDGNEWLVPVARSFPNGTCLPERILIGPDGEWIKEIIPEYVAMSQKAEVIWKSAESTGEFTETFEESADMALMALSINYRIGRHEVGALELFTTQNLSDVLLALVDWPTVEWLLKEDSKKKELGSPPSGDGSPGPNTSPPSPTLNTPSEGNSDGR